MHEMIATQSLLDTALRYAERNGARRVTQLNLELGELSFFMDEAIQFYWDIVSQGTPAEGARLHFEHTPVLLRCLGCDTHFPPDERVHYCPTCGKLQMIVSEGHEFRLESIEVE